MNLKKLSRSAVLSVLMCLILLSSLSAATYAWFSDANRQVHTNRIDARTAQSEVQLLLSNTASFTDAASTLTMPSGTITLLPVSTANLADFYHCPFTEEDLAAKFLPVEDESFFYHSRIYIMARGTNLHDGDRIDLYLDGSSEGGDLLTNLGGNLADCARLGLVFLTGDTVVSSIPPLRFSEDDADVPMNTVINGILQESGIVLARSADASDPVPVPDPSVMYTDYQVTTALPEKKLISLTPNTVYSLDIFFYLEGCDPDCINTVQENIADLQFWFYGAFTGGAHEG